MLFTLAVRGEVSNHLMHALRYLRANGLALSEQHWLRPALSRTHSKTTRSKTECEKCSVMLPIQSISWIILLECCNWREGVFHIVA